MAEEERRAGAHLIRPGSALRARDQVGLRALNDILKGAFDNPGKAASEPGTKPATQPAALKSERDETADRDRVYDDTNTTDQPPEPGSLAAMRFKQTLVRLHPGGAPRRVDPV